MTETETHGLSATRSGQASSKQRVAKLAFWSIIIGAGVMGLKFVAWWLTGSVALYSDALESIVNVVAAMAAFWAIKISHKPADMGHQHGHHKAEYFSAVLEGVLIVVAALLILFEVWRSWGVPMDAERPWLGLGINGIAAVINAIWAGALIRVGRAERSPAMVADGHHIMTDVVTSAGVLIGLVAAVVTGWKILDPALAVIVALNILWQGWHVISSSMDGLMDRAVELDEHMRIRDIISANSKGAIEVHDLKTRIAGRATFIEFHLVVDADMTVGESHVICDRIEDALRDDIPSVRVIIHVEPDDEAKLPKGTVAVPFA
ncbi:cation diffusion facilitator family transporter [Aminobacter aganoensis]|uniref:Protein p34 n=1 Tax=Aminobacter aganoensis TaxID=83264 RepID=A0A7X0FDJ6_9HYPH|nr:MULTISPECIES: cation diffusion facilitator family transporter [Aminobacter]KQU73792.1 cadmium transporter [Aminobacter sp. DSM 101952]MBB6357379.1 cation diffusion facilitator family transporter [Aminobacter aganoensis]